MPERLSLDGSYLEGGGQIVRTAVALSTLTGKPFDVHSIRAGRARPGLKAQHLHGIRAAAQLCGATFEGAELGSSRLSYSPGRLTAKNLAIDIGTAGSVTLLLQTILVPAMFVPAPIKLHIKGGTDVAWSMPADYFKEVLLHYIKPYAGFEFKLLRRGYYPRGGGSVELEIRPKFRLADFASFDDFQAYLRDQQRIEATQLGSLVRVRGISHAAKALERAEVAERQAKAAELTLGPLGCPIDIDIEYMETLSAGSGITLWAMFSTGEGQQFRLGGSSLGEKGKSAEEVGQAAATALLAEIRAGAPIDSHMADNIVPFLGLFGGVVSCAQLTPHTRTNIYVVESILGVKFKIDEANRIIECKF